VSMELNVVVLIKLAQRLLNLKLCTRQAGVSDPVTVEIMRPAVLLFCN
jgi:hypothetical protein